MMTLLLLASTLLLLHVKAAQPTNPLCSIPSSGTTTLTSNTTCKLLTQVTIDRGSSLGVVGSDQTNPATISGDYKTILFFLRGGNLTITDIVLAHGNSLQNGGAIVVEGGDNNIPSYASFVRLKIQFSRASESGGAISVDGGNGKKGKGNATVSLIDSIIEFNSAGLNGGGIFVVGTGGGALVSTTRTKFQHNIVDNGDGGAVYVIGKFFFSFLSSLFLLLFFFL